MYSSIAKSSVVSIAASAVAYLQSIILARNIPESDFAEYLYIVAWGLFLNQFVECGAIQCLTHFARTHNKSIEVCWTAISCLKAAVLIILFIIVTTLNCLTNIRIPYESFWMFVPSFYLGNIYEFSGTNVDYAKVILYEKLVSIAFATSTVILGWSIKSFYLTICFISLMSIAVQIHKYPLVKFFDYQMMLGQIKIYIKSYFLVFLVVISQLFYGNVSRLIIEKKVGVMSFALVTLSLQLVNSVSIVQTQVDRHIRPMVTEALLADSYQKTQSIVYKYFVLYLTPLAIAALIASMFSAEILQLMYGRKWVSASEVLKFALPQVVTIAGLRFIDTLLTALCKNRINLMLNLVSVFMLTSTLMISSASDAQSFMIIISTFQFVHVVVGFLLISILLTKMRSSHKDRYKV